MRRLVFSLFTGLLVVALASAGAQATIVKLGRTTPTPPKTAGPSAPSAVPPTPSPPPHWTDLVYASASTAFIKIVQAQQGNWNCAGVPVVLTFGNVAGERALDFRPVAGGHGADGSVQESSFCTTDSVNQPQTYYGAEITGNVTVGIHAVSHFSKDGWANFTLYPKALGSLSNDFLYIYDGGPGPYKSKLRYIVATGSFIDPTLGH
ncbi:MAG: hypothetical protein ACYDCK_10310 [Thermoplasmatota archaeon]